MEKKPKQSTIRETLHLPPLPPKAYAIVEQYESLRELGASKTVRMINEVLAMLATEGQFESSGKLISTVQKAAEYFRQTRGIITPAVGNALNWILRDLEAYENRNLIELQQFIHDRVEEFNRASVINTKRIASYAARLLTDGMKVIAYDYSGTVMASLQQAGDEGKRLQIIVPESRTLNGGRPIADLAVEWGHTIHFIADATISHYIKDSRIVLEGVETLLANGDFLGTPGTYTVSLLAAHFQVPFYALTETLKIATGSLFGPIAPVGNRWLENVFDYPDSFPKPEMVSVESPGLENVPAKFISAYITENGVIPPQAIWYEARRLLDQ